MKLFLKSIIKGIIIGAVFNLLCTPFAVFALEGDCGYEGGISSGVAVNKKYDYKEMVFITGKPVVVQGELAVKKSVKATSEAWTYTYTNLKSADGTIVLNRTISFDVAINNKDGNQIQRQVTIKGTPSETIKVDKITDILKKYSFSKSTLTDKKPIASYFAGEFMGEKTYTISGGTGTSAGALKVVVNGKTYGYSQYWSNSEVQNIQYFLQGTKGGAPWSGTARVGISMTTTKKMNYEKNKPDAISFEGGYVQTENNLSILEYDAEFPEFDTKDKATDYLIKTQDALKFETFPTVTRLIAPPLRQIKAHWAENDIKLAYALEVFKEKAVDFKPNDYMTRREFARVLIMTGRLMTNEEIVKAEDMFEINGTAAKAKSEATALFSDVPVDYPYYLYIKKAYDSELMSGVSLTQFDPSNTITRAQAITLVIRALGFEDRAPGPIAVTSFKDNDKIPSWARSGVYVAEKLGLVKGDEYGNFNPNKKMTKAEIAVMIIRFIDYMRQDIIKDYRENAVLY